MSTLTTSVFSINSRDYDPIVVAAKKDYAGPFFGINLPPGVESSALIQNLTLLTKMAFDSPQNAKLFIQLDSIALNSSLHPGHRILTAPNN